MLNDYEWDIVAEKVCEIYSECLSFQALDDMCHYTSYLGEKLLVVAGYLCPPRINKGAQSERDELV